MTAVIIGAGLCGLSIAYHLAASGVQVTVLEQSADQSPQTTAALAAAGMLAPQIEVEPGEEGLLPLMLAARNAWPQFVKTIQDHSSIDINYRTQGTIVAAADHDDGRVLKRQFDYLSQFSDGMQWLDRDALLEQEPYLAPNVTGGYLSPHDHQVDSRAVLRALRIACVNLGVQIVYGTKAQKITDKTVYTQDKNYTADHIVVANGAWASLLPNAVPDHTIRPVKGQMLALHMPQPILTHVLWGTKVYFAPKSDGRLLIGATVEEQGFDTNPTAGGIYTLLDEARKLLPGIEELDLIETWAGLRPGSLDDAPIIGKYNNVYVAGGAFRNGVLLCPLIGKGMAQLMLDGGLPNVLQGYTPQRFLS